MPGKKAMFLLSIFVPLLAAKAGSQPMTDALRPNINLRRAVRTYCVHEYTSVAYMYVLKMLVQIYGLLWSALSFVFRGP